MGIMGIFRRGTKEKASSLAERAAKGGHSEPSLAFDIETSGRRFTSKGYLPQTDRHKQTVFLIERLEEAVATGKKYEAMEGLSLLSNHVAPFQAYDGIPKELVDELKSEKYKGAFEEEFVKHVETLYRRQYPICMDEKLCNERRKAALETLYQRYPDKHTKEISNPNVDIGFELKK